MSTEILSAILATLERIEARLVVPISGSTRPLSSHDQEALTRLLPAIRDSLGGAVWTAADLQLQARMRDPALKAKLEASLGDGGSLKSLGKLLTRAAGSSVAGLTITRIGKVREGVLWRVDS